MRTNPETILLAKIRKHIRNAISWHKVDNGMPHFWSSESYVSARHKRGTDGNHPYYIRSDKAIKNIAERIVEEVRKNE